MKLTNRQSVLFLLCSVWGQTLSTLFCTKFRSITRHLAASMDTSHEDVQELANECKQLSRTIHAAEDVSTLGQPLLDALEVLLEKLCAMSIRSAGSPESSSQPAYTKDDLMNAVWELQDQVRKVLAALSKSQKDAARLARAVERLAIVTEAAVQKVQQYSFLAEFRDYIGAFRELVVIKVSATYEVSSWAALSSALRYEESEPSAP